MSTRIKTERILVVGDSASIERAGVAHDDRCLVEIASSLQEAAEKQAASSYDRVIVDPSALSGPPLQILSTVPGEPPQEDEALRKAVERQRLAASAGGVGLWEWDLVTGKATWDDACKMLFGLAPDADVSLDVFVALVHPDERAELERLNRIALAEPTEFVHTFRAVLPDGSLHWFTNRGRTIADGTGRVVRMLGASIDVTEPMEAERELARQRQLLETTIESTDVMLAYLDCDFRFVMANTAYVTGCGHSREELIGRNHFELFPDEENEAIFRRVRDTGEQVSFRAKPFEYPDQPWRGVTYWDWTLVPVKSASGEVTGLVFSLTDVTEIKLAEERILRHNDRLQLLSEIAGELLVRENPHELLQSLCERVMQHLDCQVFLNFLCIEEKGCLHLNACAGIAADAARDLEWLEYGKGICGRVAQSGEPIVMEDIAETLDPVADQVRAYGIAAFACHPLLSEGGRAIGTLAFGSRTRASFTDGEISMMKTIANQVATAMERVRTIEAQKRVYEREHKIAEILQQALVPPDPPTRIGNYRFAVRYRAALSEASVGGDFYDIFDIGEDRIGVVIGDVVGKGLSAAIRVAAARYSIRGYAYIDPQPGRVLTLANDALCRDAFDEVKMLTALFAVIDTRAGVMTYSNAGHEAPLVIDRVGDVSGLRLPGLPLGISEGYAYDEQSVRLRAGDTVVLVTDGITEARRPGPVLFGVGGVVEYLRRHHDSSIEEIAEGVLGSAIEHAEGVLQDDAAIIVIEQSHTPADET